MVKIAKLSDIEVYNEALVLAREVYSLTRKSILNKDYSLLDQIRRATLSVAANIAEGYGRKSRKDFSRFLSVSLGSLNETITYLDFISLEYNIDNTIIINKYNLLAQRIASFRKYLSATTNYPLQTNH